MGCASGGRFARLLLWSRLGRRLRRGDRLGGLISRNFPGDFLEFLRDRLGLDFCLDRIRELVALLRLFGLRGPGLNDQRPEVLAGLVAAGELLVRGDAAEPRAGQRGVRAALAVREDGDTAPGEVVAVGAGEGCLRLGLRELGIGLDINLPA